MLFGRVGLISVRNVMIGSASQFFILLKNNKKNKVFCNRNEEGDFPLIMLQEGQQVSKMDLQHI